MEVIYTMKHNCFFLFVLFRKLFEFIKDFRRKCDKGYYRYIYRIPTSFIAGYSVNIHGEGELIVGENSYIGTNSAINLAKECSVSIGDNVSISHNVRIYTTTKESIKDPCGNSKVRNRDVNIGNNVWVGANVVVLPGVTICDNVTIGANSVVYKSIETPGVYTSSTMNFIKGY
uniref:Galactoside O-acetyltransferase n=1 Tax=Vibrio parahaemolyticus TaxID=670 RepID=A0A7M1VY96_VIBPH|nr:galactoside O-acetyltransferase [Vibrio parahaemolyticus]QOS25699.1 galactoside O-acetyltransferase [Vibrio parahaemolyticus]QOS25844.1 galactoside O-acetyltransferase [Vibrio parahaemolyticus]